MKFFAIIAIALLMKSCVEAAPTDDCNKTCETAGARPVCYVTKTCYREFTSPCKFHQAVQCKNGEVDDATTHNVWCGEVANLEVSICK